MIYSDFVSLAWASQHSAKEIYWLLPSKIVVIYRNTYFSGNALIYIENICKSVGAGLAQSHKKNSLFYRGIK